MQADQKQIVDKVKAIMADESIGPLAQYLKIKTLLLEAKVGYFSILSCETILVHPANRGGLGINHFNAHKTGSNIYKLGADLSQLEQACCMELHPIGPARDNEIEKNKKLVERSAGMLAPVTGSERVASVGNSHCAAFCKAAIARCFTNITCIADAAGRIDLNLLASSNSNFATMLGQVGSGLLCHTGLGMRSLDSHT